MENRTETHASDAYDILNDLDTDLEAVSRLVDMIDEIVFEESHCEGFDPNVQGQVIVLFDAIRARLRQADTRTSTLLDDYLARKNAADLTVTPDEAAAAVKDLRATAALTRRRHDAGKVARRSRQAVRQ